MSRVVHAPDDADVDLDCKKGRCKNEEKLAPRKQRISSILRSDQECVLGGWMLLKLVSPGDLLCCTQSAPQTIEDKALRPRAVDAYRCYHCDAHAGHSSCPP